mgnify:CR=1 FL=1
MLLNESGGMRVQNTSPSLGGANVRLSFTAQSNFNYTTGPYQNLPADTPAKRYLFRTDFNLNSRPTSAV